LDEHESDGLMLFQPDTECSAMPLRLHAKPPSQATFSRWKNELAEKVKRLAPYRHFAAGICQSVLWREQYGIGPLAFRHGLRWHSRTERAAEQVGPRFSPAMDAEMHEIVDVYCYENNISLTLHAAAAQKNSLEERLEKFIAVLELAGSNPAINMASLSARQTVLDTAV
jgi:hypothetical protein